MISKMRLVFVTVTTLCLLPGLVFADGNFSLRLQGKMDLNKGETNMKYLVSLLSLAGCILGSQQIIENPNKPKREHYRNTISLREVLRIRDFGERFFFKLPWGIDVADDGSIFVKDMDKLYKFSANGKFEKNMVRIGQGPGEITREIDDFAVMDNRIVISCASMNKLITLDIQGNLIKESIPKKKLSQFIAYYDNKYYFVDQVRKDLGKVEGMTEFIKNLYVSDEAGNSIVTSLSFPIKWYFFRDARGLSLTRIVELQTSQRLNKYVYISNTQEYCISQLDLEDLRITRRFKRDYPRVKFISNITNPSKYYNDVYRILIYEGEVWIITSTYDISKGIMVDIFNEEGEFLDNRCLPLLNSRAGDSFFQLYYPLIIKGDYLYAIEHDDDWNYTVAKYEIIK